MLTTAKPAKTSACFICNQDFPLSELTAHEKSCLDNIKENDTQYTRQSGDDSSDHSFPATYNSSNLSTHSSSSGESSSEKKYSRCYICGSDVPSYLASIHEKNCKKSWETGLLNSICTPARKSKSKGDVSSLSRSSSKEDILQNSKTDMSISTPNLTKSKSTTNIGQDINNESPQTRKDIKSRYLNTPIDTASTARRGSTGQTNIRSTKSSSSLLKTSSSSRSLVSSNDSLSKSSQDITDGGLSKSPRKADPQYVICQICGRLYSKHSINIHQRSCERTYKKQKDVGTNVEYKIKSKSLADLTKPLGSNSRRPNSALSNNNIRKTPTKRPPEKLSNGSSALSKSTGNLGPSYRRQLLTKKKDVIIDGEASPPLRATPARPEIDNTKASPGLQKCYLCMQLYGTRSLPIHEKQCLKKWERERALEEEKKKNKSKKPRKQRDIKIMAFGRSKFEEDEDEFDLESETIQKPIVTASKLFGVPSPLKKEDELDTIDHGSLLSGGLANGEITSSNSSKTSNNNSVKSPGGPKFVSCIYCHNQYGIHSIAIHEKGCRQKDNVERKAKERIFSHNNHSHDNKNSNNKKLSKSVGDITLSDAFNSSSNNGSAAANDMFQLVKCDECMRKFLKTDIEKHRIHCRVSIL